MLIITEKTLIMSLPLASPFSLFCVRDYVSLSDLLSLLPLFSLLHISSVLLAFFRDANYVKYSHDIRMPLKIMDLPVVSVDSILAIIPNISPFVSIFAASLPPMLQKKKKRIFLRSLLQN